MSTTNETDLSISTLPLDTEHKPSEKQEKEYSISRYLKEHTTLAVTCVSATVAATSFLFHYAIILYNSTYLKYWNIDTIYMGKDHSIQIYTVFAAFVYCLILLGVHFLLSNTSDVYRLNNKLMSATKKSLKSNTTTIKHLKKEIKPHTKTLSRSPTNSKAAKDAKKKLRPLQTEVDRLKRNLLYLKVGIKCIRKYFIKHISVTFAVAFLLCTLSTLFLYINLQKPITAAGLFSLPAFTIFFDCLIYYVPAYIATSPKKSVDSDIVSYSTDFTEGNIPPFPLEKFSLRKLKKSPSNTTIIIFIAQYIFSAIACLIMFYQFGGSAAAQKTEFPILFEAEQMYAIVYNNGQHVIMEPAVIVDNTLNINTSIQHILSVDDICYEIQTFDSVALSSNSNSQDK